MCHLCPFLAHDHDTYLGCLTKAVTYTVCALLAQDEEIALFCWHMTMTYDRFALRWPWHQPVLLARDHEISMCCWHMTLTTTCIGGPWPWHPPMWLAHDHAISKCWWHMTMTSVSIAVTWPWHLYMVTHWSSPSVYILTKYSDPRLGHNGQVYTTGYFVVKLHCFPIRCLEKNSYPNSLQLIWFR